MYITTRGSAISQPTETAPAKRMILLTSADTHTHAHTHAHAHTHTHTRTYIYIYIYISPLEDRRFRSPPNQRLGKGWSRRLAPTAWHAGRWGSPRGPQRPCPGHTYVCKYITFININVHAGRWDSPYMYTLYMYIHIWAKVARDWQRGRDQAIHMGVHISDLYIYTCILNHIYMYVFYHIYIYVYRCMAKGAEEAHESHRGRALHIFMSVCILNLYVFTYIAKYVYYTYRYV